MRQKSLVKNFIYNSMYNGLNLMFPLITAPYISRTLGASNLGIVNFATTVVNWFILFAIFGTTTYGVREVAKNRNNNKKLNSIFSEIVIINGTLSILVTIIYFIIVLNVKQFRTELPLYLIMSINIILNMFSIDWLYQGIEEYRYITIRSAIFKIISLISIFLFIKESGDYVLYGLISVMSTSFSGILNYIYSRNFVKLTFKKISPLRHFKKLKIFFVHALIVNLYTNFDQVLLGFLVNTKSVAYMTRSKVITSTAILLSSSISNVTLPRASYYFENDRKKFNELLKVVPNYILIITIPLTAGIIALSKNIMYILGGMEFVEASNLLMILSIIIIFSSLATWLHQQILVPVGMEKVGMFSAVVVSIYSITSNLILIPIIGYIGAGLTQVISEVITVAIRYFYIKKILDYKEINIINKSTVKYVFSAIIMFFIVISVNSNFSSDLGFGFLISAFFGVLTYFSILLVTKEKITLEIMERLIKYLHKEK